jgi:hypothetical protein
MVWFGEKLTNVTVREMKLGYWVFAIGIRVERSSGAGSFEYYGRHWLSRYINGTFGERLLK